MLDLSRNAKIQIIIRLVQRDTVTFRIKVGPLSVIMRIIEMDRDQKMY